MEANGVCRNCAKYALEKDARIYAKIGQCDLNNSCFSRHLLIFSILLPNVKYFTLLLASDCVGSKQTKNA